MLPSIRHLPLNNQHCSYSIIFNMLTLCHKGSSWQAWMDKVHLQNVLGCQWKIIKDHLLRKGKLVVHFLGRSQNQQTNTNWCLVESFSSAPAIPMTLMGLLPMSSSMAVPWWLTNLSDPFLNCSITVVITTLAKGINWPKMSQMSIILMYAVDGNLSITAMKMVVITNIVVRFTVTEAFYMSFHSYS